MSTPIPDLVYQGEVSECGLACICMLAQSVGLQLELAELRQRYPAPQAGASMAELLDILEALNINAYPVRFDPAHVAYLPTPALLHYRGSHFVVAGARKGRQIWLLNPATGACVMRADSLAPSLSGYAILVDGLIQPATLSPARPKVLFNANVVTVPHATRMLGYTLLVGAAAFLTPLLVAGTVGGAGGLGVVGMFGAFVLFALLAMVCELYLARHLAGAASALLTQHMPVLFGQLLRKHKSYFDRRSAGDIQQRFQALHQALADRPRLNNEQSGALCVAAAAVLAVLWLNVWLALISVVAIAATGWVSLYFGSTRQALLLRQDAFNATRSQLVLESIRGIATLKSAEVLNQRHAQFADQHGQAVQAWASVAQLDARQRAWYALVANAEIVTVLAAALPLINRGSISLPGFFAFFFCRQIALTYASRFYMARLQAKVHQIAQLRADDMLSFPSEALATPVQHFARNLQLQALAFDYGHGAAVFSQLGLCIEVGQKIAIIGASGSGKSTLLKVVAGFHQPTHGQLTVDGKAASFAGLRGLAFYQQPEDILFEGSVLDNLRVFQTDISRRICQAALDTLGLTDCIQQLPAGLDTVISEANPQLSSGQRQRLLLGRALCCNKPLLVLDEPTANLDAASAQRVMQALHNSGKTLLVALHDASLLPGFDQVWEVVSGRLVRRA